MGDLKIIAPLTANDRNECAEPSFETTLTNWATGGTNTLALSTEQQYRGKNAAKITYSNSTTLLSLAQTFLNANTSYYLTFKVYVPATWNGGNLLIGASGYASGALDSDETVNWTAGTSPTGVWYTVKAKLDLAADVAGTITLTTSSAPSAGRYIYVDAVQFSLNDSEYFDGDSRFAWWEGNRHLSISQMDYRNQAHGVLTDPADQGVCFGPMVGGDLDVYVNTYQARAVGYGAELTDARRGARPVTFPVTVPGTATMYPKIKKWLENLLRARRTGLQPLTVESTAGNANVPVYLDVLTDRLSLGQNGYTGQGAWQATAQDPRWYERGDRYAALSRSQSLSVAYLLGWLNESGFDNLDETAGSGQVRALAVDVNNDLLIGGMFSNWAGNADADNIARYVRATATWTSLFSSGANSTVNDILVLDDGRLVIVGAFTSIGGTAANRVAIWDGATITALGTGFNAECYTVEYDYRNNYLYFGGAFTTADGVTVNYIAQYDLTAGTFAALDSGANGDVRSIYIQPSGNVLAGGEFTEVGSPAIDAYHMARYVPSTSTWNALAGGSGAVSGTNGAVYSILVGDNNKIYIGGDFTTVAGVSCNNVAWRYVSNPHWYSLGNGVTGGTIPVEFMYWDAVLNKLLISGQFTDVDGKPTDQAVYWNGSAFEALALDFPSSSTVYNFVRNPRTGDYFIAFDTTGTMTVPSATTNVTNTGTEQTWPQFHFEGGGSIGSAYATLQFIYNQANGARLAFNDLHLNEGAEVVIDLTPGRVQVYRLIGQTRYDLTEGAFTRDSDVAAFVLEPGVNPLVVAAADGNGTPTITAYVLWRNRHGTFTGAADDL